MIDISINPGGELGQSRGQDCNLFWNLFHDHDDEQYSVPVDVRWSPSGGLEKKRKQKGRCRRSPFSILCPTARGGWPGLLMASLRLITVTSQLMTIESGRE